MKCSLGISNFLEEISSLSHSVVFLYFFALITEEGFLISSSILWNSAFRCLYQVLIFRCFDQVILKCLASLGCSRAFQTMATTKSAVKEKKKKNTGVAMPSSRESSPSRDGTLCLLHFWQILYWWVTMEANHNKGKRKKNKQLRKLRCTTEAQGLRNTKKKLDFSIRL